MLPPPYINCGLSVSDNEKARATGCIAMAEAMSRNMNQGLYIIDYNIKGFLYVSPNPLFLCGHLPEEVIRKGYAFYFEVVPSAEIERLMEIKDFGFRFFYEQPIEKRLHLSIEYNFHLCSSNGRTVLVHQKLTPILLDEKGSIGLVLCTLSLSSERNIGEVIITDHMSSERYVYSFEQKRWRKYSGIELSIREREILQLSVRGMSNMEIGESLFINVNTVKFHKKKLFLKLHVKNIIEAISVASNLKLI